MKQTSKEKQQKINSNHLINRLFKNSQQKQKKPVNISALDMSPTQQPYLIPKIVKNKLKPIEPDKRLRSKLFSHHEITSDLEHSHSKNLLDQSIVTGRSPMISKVRSKMYSLIDDSQIDDRKMQQESEEKKFLSPADFMEILKIDREMSDEFCYLNKRQNSYDWQIVQFEKKNPSEYMIISKRGLTKYLNNQVEFMKFQQFLEEQKVFLDLNRIDYFRLYVRKKYFQIWKKYTNIIIFLQRSKEFNEKSLYSDLQIKEIITEVKRICLYIEKVETFYCANIPTMKVVQFKDYVESEKIKTIGKIKKIEEAVLQMIGEKAEMSMNLYMKKMRISKQSQKGSLSEKKIPLLIGDETGKDMPYTESATIRTHLTRIRNLLKLTDYLMITSKTELVLNMVTFLTDSIRDVSQFYQEDKKSFASNSWLEIQLYQEQKQLYFNPEESEFTQYIQEIFYNTLEEIYNHHFQFLHLAQFHQYWACNIESEKTDQFIELKNIIQLNDTYNDKISSFKIEIKKAYHLMVNYTAVFNHSLAFLEFVRNTQSEQHTFPDKNVEFFQNVMATCKEERKKIQEIESIKEIGIICLNSGGYKEKIIKSCEDLLLKIHSSIPSILMSRSQKLLKNIRENYELINSNPITINEYIEFLKNTIKVNAFSEETQPIIGDNSMLLTLAESYSIKISDPIKNSIGQANGNMIGLSRRLSEIEKNSADLADKFKKQIEKLIPSFREKIKSHSEKLSEAQLLKINQTLEKKIIKIDTLWQSLEVIINDKNQFLKFQEELSFDLADFSQIDHYQTNFKNIQSMYQEKDKFQKFLMRNQHTNVQSLKFDEVKKYLDFLHKKIIYFQRQIQPNQIIVHFKQIYDNFKPLFYSIEALRNSFLEEKHKEQMKAILKKNIENSNTKCTLNDLDLVFNMENADSRLTIQFFKALEVDLFKDEFVSIAIQAEKQYELIDMVSKVESIWRHLAFTTIPFKEAKEGNVLGNNDQLITKIDDNLMIINNVLASKYVTPIKPRVQLQSRMLRYMQDLIDQWYLHQKNWIYLEPILKSPFAMKNLPKETAMFNQLDVKWKIIMKTAKDAISIKRYSDEYQTNYTLKVLKANNQTFQVVQKTLQNFLQKKRDLFQRFYFLSNDQLLQILSTVKSFDQIEPHLRKVFENFVKIGFDEKGIPCSMGSIEGEEVALRNCVFRGEVEEWFKSCQESMKSTLKSIVRVALLKYSEEGMKRGNWIKLFPSQIILVVDCIMWTTITEGYLQNLDENDISEWYNTNISQLNELVQLIRTDLPPIQRKTLVALITQDVHFRDIIQNLQTCESMTDFKWLQQLRFYSVNELVFAKQVQSELFYGYEYLGPTSRLVITPLTDRCWMTITGALHIKLGANPAGPAGTGKTESCKDLAKSLGRYCIVFNCSDQINALMMQKLFSGLAYTGSWTCLDEFNRIDIEVLSVIAQQVLTIREALMLGKHNRELVLGGKQIYLNHDLGIFITMNPGYAGRTELPDNLKMLFRPVAMMVPDYTLIAEIMLFSEGFSSAKQLSKKMTKLYKLSSEQLSQQDHYDFGMRAVKSVLVMAGGLKRAEPDVAEDIILIRAMQEANIPKFLSHDIPLFNGIIEDLFPTVRIPKRNQVEFEAKLQAKCLELKIVGTDAFIEKTLQLNETLKVRFGVMLVGPPMSSKTSIIKVLLDVFPQVINPKSVSLSELYGNFDTMTQTWTDGLAAKLLRQSAVNHDYVVFDGPVDAIWVENLNTVLDDSMMLCLSNGERIKLSSKMRILFEVMDLNQASPATVSRCGMVWVSEDVVHWEELVNSFFQINPILEDQQLTHIIHLIKYSFKKGYTFIKKFAKEVVKLNPSTIVHSYCKFVKNMVQILPEESLQAETWKKALEKICIFSYVWSVGAILSEDSKSRLDKSLSEFFSAENLKSPIINFTLSFKEKEEGEWVSWTMIMPEYDFPENVSYLDVFVPTKETYCYTFILERFVSNLDPVFVTAPTGTGKTSIIDQLLKKSQQAALIFTFTAQTSPSVAQIQLESRLQNQRKMGSITLIPPPGKKFIYFIDDINMPGVEQYGAQPPIEMLRLLLGSKGVWDRKTHIFKMVEGVQMIVAGTYGRTELPPRFLRFFNTIYIPELDEESLVLIFAEITKGYFQRFKIKAEIMDLITNKSIVNSTLNLYSMIKAELLPTPQKSHYLFNLRDVSRVFQGLTCIKQTILTSPEVLIKLWVHQFQRVFEDRLISEKDKTFIRDQISKKVAVTLKSNLTQQSLYENPIFFCNFLKKGLDRKDLVYEEVKDYNKFVKIITDCMTDETNMNLVLFSDAIAHVSRVARALQFDKGHILLVGLSGSGKKSMITLATTVSQSIIQQIQIRKNYGKIQFREDIFKIMKKAALENKQVNFLFAENHMIDESFLEDINNLLSSGEIPCMFSKENLEQINQNGGYQPFLRRILSNLHITLTLSPVGNQFRTKLRNFPSLINCCLIDWVDKWPEEALISVASIKLEDRSVAEACVYAHLEVEKLADEYLLKTRRKVFITAKNYITLIETFNHLLGQQVLKIDTQIGKLSNGVYKLEEANAIIQDLQAKLTQMQPILEIKTIEQETLLKKLEIDRSEASQVKIVVEEEEKIIAEKAEKATDEKREADKILNDALPALHAANEALNTLNRNDISEIKMNQNPHAQVKFTLECVSILLQEKDDWESVRKTISDINFISRLKNMDVYHIHSKVEQNIKAKLKTNPNFKPNQIKQVNFAAKSFCQWVLAVVSFNEVNKEIVKKKDIVKKLNEELDISNKQLQSKRDQLSGIVSKVKALQNLFKASKEQKQKIDQQIILTKNRLVNAGHLTDGLKNEKVRWAESLIALNHQKLSIVGNTFLSTCCVAYYGSYSGIFRESFIKLIFEKVTGMQIKVSEKFSLREILGDNLQISDWINYGLPKDQISINNAILVQKTMQNPMMIDPQLQASKWVRNKEKKNDIVQFKIGTDGLLKKIESALRMKYSILLEMTETQIDPSLDALLSKDYQHHNNRSYVRLAQTKIEIQKDLKIYVYTKNSNPNFNPEVFIKLCVINFTVTSEGLQDQLLADVVENEIPEVELKKKQLVLIISKGRLTLAKNQDTILALLNNSKGFILDDVELIKNLKQSKRVSAEVNISLEESVIKSKEIQQAREVYQPVAIRGALLYLIVTDLSAIEPMYQFSLEYFSRIFRNVLNSTEVTQEQTRVTSLINNLTKTVYKNISRALFNQHKTIFSFIIATRVAKIAKSQYDYFLKGNFSIKNKQKERKQSIKQIHGLSLQVSESLENISKIIPNSSIAEYFHKEKDRITAFHEDPLRLHHNSTFKKEGNELTCFQALLITKIIKPELTVQAISMFIKETLDQSFVDSTAPTMQQIYSDTICKIPLTFILSVGADPLQNLLRFGKDIGKKNEDIMILSLGQGQGPPAIRAIQSAIKDGQWVILQNCHLGKSFLPHLEKKIQEINDSQEMDENFRLFLTCMPCDYFPISILQNSLKITSEPPRGIKPNLKKLLNNVNWGESDEQKTFAFNLCFFHAVALQRRKFGSLGWNILYDFNESDLETSLTIVANLLSSNQDIPYDAIQYFVGEIVYGGRVTDQFDRRMLKTQLYDFISFQSIEKPKVKPIDLQHYLQYVAIMKEEDDPAMFGLNQNAQKTYLMKITTQALTSIMMLEPQEAVTSANSNTTLLIINDILQKIPAIIKKNQDKKVLDALDICLSQESVRFNYLIVFIDKNLKQLLQAIRGQAIMTESLEKIFLSISQNQVPREWEKKAYPSMKPLASWLQDFLERVKFMRAALTEKPKLYWISAFFFPQGFLTSILQIYARKMKLAVDSLGFSFIFKQNSEKQYNENSPSDGCLISGLYSQACCIDFKSSFLKESPPNILDSEVPVIHFKPIQTAKNEINYSYYEIPVYKTKKRAGTLSTTGHSTNYIISVVCKSDQDQSFWIKRGAAFFCALEK